MEPYGYLRCPWCGKQLVEVDNPYRREIRHRRGEEYQCPGPPPEQEEATSV